MVIIYLESSTIHPGERTTQDEYENTNIGSWIIPRMIKWEITVIEEKAINNILNALFVEEEEER